MRRGAKVTKRKVDAKPPRARTSRKNEHTRVRDLEKRLAEALEQQAATAEILRVISSSPTNVQPVFDAIAASAVRVCGARIASVFHFDGELIHLIAHHGYTPEALELRRGLFPAPPQAGSITGRAIQSRALVHVPDALADDTYPYRDFARAAKVRSVIGVPMLRDGRPIGVVTVSRAEPVAFTERQVELLETFTDQALIAIENARLFKELDAKNRELERLSADMEQLYRLSTAMQEPLSLREQLGRVLETATRMGVIDRTYVWALNAEADKLVNLAGAGFAPDEWKELEMKEIPVVEAGAMGKAFREGQPLLFDDANALPRELYLSPRYLVKAIRTSRFLVIPMIARGETVGVFTCDNKLTRRPISQKTVDLLQTFASHAAVAIQNARLFREIEQKSRELEVASRHKSEFLANMSHELRTPLNAIIGFSEVLADGMFGQVNEKQAEYLRDILESGRHLLSLINDILDLSKIEAGRMELELTDFDLSTAIDNTLTFVRERAVRRGITLGRAIDERVGLIRADERKVKQVFLNLLSNALKFTPESGRVDVRAGIRDDVAEISVTDTGVGIAPEDQEAVFEEFRQVGTADKKVEGTRLGLALARKFVGLHGGRIWVKSQVGVGSTFTFTIPVRRGEDMVT
jgi:signal transduction histidine kinase